MAGKKRYGAHHLAAPASIIDPRYVNGSGVRRAPSGFSLAAKPPGACTPAHNRVEPPILIVLDQNRKTGACFAEALHGHISMDRDFNRSSGDAQTGNGRNSNALTKR